MNREKQDKIPSMQVSFIDAICTQLYEVNHMLLLSFIFNIIVNFKLPKKPKNKFNVLKLLVFDVKCKSHKFEF